MSDNYTDDVIVQKRLPGRPKFIKTGWPGRPRKEYRTLSSSNLESENINVECLADDVFEQENANIVEIPFEKAISSQDKSEWQMAINLEFKSLLKNRDIIDRPIDKNVVGCKMVLTNKLYSNGSLERRKARLVAKGYSQC